jgi:hypothetical protein
MKYGIAVSNGTTALQVAVGCLDLKPGDEVIMPTFTIISCALAIVESGGVPVLVDSEPRTWCMDVHQVESKITPRTRAIMPVHIYGHPVDMDPLSWHWRKNITWRSSRMRQKCMAPSIFRGEMAGIRFGDAAAGWEISAHSAFMPIS